MRTLREWLTGPPLPTAGLGTERLNKIRALAAFSPDALSSIAYANQEIYLGLAIAGAAGLVYAWPIALAITCLLAILTVSYAQTIPAYPHGGGSYTVARENLGSKAGLVAAAALMVDYVLTAAVSLTAGVDALASAFPALWPHRVSLALALLLIITLANLRGVRESAGLMSVPVYFFLASFLGMLGWGLWRAWQEGPVPYVQSGPAVPVTTFLLLHAFATGCTALTGIEAISNGVPAFREPTIRNARQTLVVMALFMALLFLPSVGLTLYFGVTPRPDETILSALAHRLLGSGLPYLAVQAGTLLVLAVAANTSFAGFPRLASVLAKDRYLPHQFSHLGDRLVYSNGMIALAVASGLLIVLFGGDTHSLIPLFAVGVFLAFTLSQAGMVLHWRQVRGRGWVAKALINGVGAVTTGITVLVVAVSKFTEGAWIVVLLIPILVAAFQAVSGHYREVARELKLRGLPPSLKPLPSPRVVVPISGVHRGVVEALRYARSISDRVTAVYVETSPGDAKRIRQDWPSWGQGVPLVIVPSPYRSVIGPFLDFLDETDQKHNDGTLATVLIPEFVPAHWWQQLLHNQTAWLMRLALLYRRRRPGHIRAIIDIPFHLRE